MYAGRLRGGVTEALEEFEGVQHVSKGDGGNMYPARKFVQVEQGHNVQKIRAWLIAI